jgi:hypothetical protein
MLKPLFLLLALSVFGTLAAQSIDNRLLKRYSEAELVVIKNQDPEKYTMLVYALDHAFYVTARPAGKTEGVEEERALEITKESNYIDLGLEILNRNQYIPIAGTDKMLVVKSEWVLMNELKTKKP